jgi:predicted nucleic acid-binding protein
VENVYADASALTKLVAKEPESAALSAFVAGVQLLSSELVRAEVPRAVRRIASEDRSLELEELLLRSDELLDASTLAPVESITLQAAGEIPVLGLRTLDAIHVITAIYLDPIDAFLTYDVRQAASARRAGLRTVAPGT